MPKAPEKFPKVFLACPFDVNMQTLKDELEWLPWNVYTPDEEIKSDHLLTKITQDISQRDLCIFDISGWNPNVCLELGLAKALGWKFYIINNDSYGSEAPSDIRGIDRINYNWNKKKNAKSLYYLLRDRIFKNQFYSKRIWISLKNQDRASQKFDLALTILARLKVKGDLLLADEIKKLANGYNFSLWSVFSPTSS